MKRAAARSDAMRAQDVPVTLRFGIDTGARQSHQIDPRNGQWASRSSTR